MQEESPLKVTKDGGKVDAITASTITSRAFIDAVERAYRAFQVISGSSVDAGTDATEQASESTEQQVAPDSTTLITE